MEECSTSPTGRTGELERVVLRAMQVATVLWLCSVQLLDTGAAAVLARVWSVSGAGGRPVLVPCRVDSVGVKCEISGQWENAQSARRARSRGRMEEWGIG